MVVTVEELDAAETLDLRSRVLRDGRAHEGFPEDADPTAFHLGVRSAGAVVGVASFIRRGKTEWQLRGMAVDPTAQRRGVGRALLAEGLGRLRSVGAERLWADGRDAALAFYEKVGFRVVGEGFVPPSGVPHHRIELDLQ